MCIVVVRDRSHPPPNLARIWRCFATAMPPSPTQHRSFFGTVQRLGSPKPKESMVDESESSQGTLSEQCHSPDRSISQHMIFDGGIDLTSHRSHRLKNSKCSSMGTWKELLWKLPDATSQELAVVAAQSQ